MKKQTVQMNQSSQVNIRYIESSDVFVAKQDGATILISGNLIRHQLGIPYTKKDGTLVSKKEIELSNRKNRQVYAAAVARNAKARSHSASKPKPKVG